ncbi:putative integral membrane protein (plasmid) [Granulicella tundricola MP5ACTX9]|uniref:Putative integral membrane protein n=1 Tax=Granulicella tundricola (strain ATCC BAA-1859 / DSM 23138 / MP5ACTX9) TaxID=1198114 RepID=E8X733_GRATM|nr:putative integral membrane protein [Granulicella tundricola MP5ACTX9]
MHLIAAATVFVVLSLVGVEFSIAAFVDPTS